MTIKIKPAVIKSKLEKQIKELEELKKIYYSEGGEEGMYSVDANVKSLLTVAFEDSKERNRDYQGICIAVGGLPPEVEQKHYLGDLTSRIRTLNAWVGEMDLLMEIDSGAPEEAEEAKSPPTNIEERLSNILNKFHIVAKQLESRYSSRKTLIIEDEYDVQDLLHALLKIEFDDVRDEEPNPSCGGKSTKSDFLLKIEEKIIEVKHTRKNLKDKELFDELALDHARYKGHSNCKELICFIYDPQHLISNRPGLKSDLEGLDTEGKLPVKVFISP